MTPQRTLYLCPPDYLELKYAINPWMDQNAPFSQKKALQQWQNLVTEYQKICPEAVEIIPAKEGLTELCFCGDSVFSYQGKTLFSRMATAERFPETEYVISALAERGIRGERVPEGIIYEGSGETLLWNNKILVGHGHRSSAEAIPFLQSYFPTEVIGLELADPNCYHLDLALFPVSSDLLAVYLPAFTEESQRKIQTLNGTILSLEKEDMEAFALNGVALDQEIFLSHTAENFGTLLTAHGFSVHYLDISEFMKFGGGIKCLTFQYYD